MRHGPVIVAVEGLEGSGKSSVITYCSELLKAQGLRVACVPEFSTTLVGDYLRERLQGNRFLLDPDGAPSAWTQIHAVAADTAIALEYTIPQLASRYDIILKDRYRESIIACQHVALSHEYGYSYEEARLLTASIVARLPDPATTIVWLEASLESRRARVQQRGDYVAGDDQTFSLREEAYRWLMRGGGNWAWRAHTLDANAPLQTVAEELLDIILTHR